MGRIQGLFETGNLTGSQLVKDAPGYVFSITLAWTGATAGNKVYLRDGTDATSAIEVTFVLDAAAGMITKEWPQGKQFDTAIFYHEGDAANVFTEMTCK